MPCLAAWANSLGGITYPLLSDFYPHGLVAQLYGVLRMEGYSERALFVIDKQGIIRYIDIHDIDDQPDNEVLFKVLEKLEPAAAVTWAALNPVKPEQIPQADVIIYCTPWCPDCIKARTFLHNHKVKFTEVNIARNRAAAERLRGWTGGKEITPCFEIRGKVLVDFKVNELEALLRAEGLFTS